MSIVKGAGSRDDRRHGGRHGRSKSADARVRTRSFPEPDQVLCTLCTASKVPDARVRRHEGDSPVPGKRKSCYEPMAPFAAPCSPRESIQHGVSCIEQDSREPVECAAESTSIASVLTLSSPDHTYVNIPHAHSSRHQLNYMELDLQARRSLRAGSPVSYAQIDRAAIAMARRVGEQHAQRRQGGRLPPEQRHKDAP